MVTKIRIIIAAETTNPRHQASEASEVEFREVERKKKKKKKIDSRGWKLKFPPLQILQLVAIIYICKYIPSFKG